MAKTVKKAAGHSTRGSKIIVLKGKENPRQKGTDGHRHYEKMKGRPTVDAYLGKFEDRGLAGRWLTNTIRDGHAKLASK